MLLPRFKLLLFCSLFLFLLIFAARLGFWLWFFDADSYAWNVTSEALSIGARFDLRLAVLLSLSVWALSFFQLTPSFRKVANGFLYSLFLIVILFYIVDFAHFSYLEERVNISVMRFAEDGLVSAQMVWESYPFIRLLIVLGLLAWAVCKVVMLLLRDSRKLLEETTASVAQKSLNVVVGLLFVLLAIMGKYNSLTPLRWSDAYFANDPKVAALGLNPVVFFWDTLFSQTRPYDKNLVEQYYPVVTGYLGLEEMPADKLNFSRSYYPEKKPVGRKPNLVFIHLESLGTNRMGLTGNQTEATPNLDYVAERGWFFPRFFVPSSGTARTVFGLLTGIPDVSWGGTTASRNPLIVDQYTLVNSLDEYEKLFFIGGAAGWANIKGLLEHNIQDLELWEEGDYKAPRIDVWGVSDRSLFKEAHARLLQIPEDKPFVAFIQTAGNHRPFTIPDDDSAFETRSVSDEVLKKFGFLGNDQYNAVRLLDYNIGYYLNELVAGTHYENNTIFIFYGDHNDRSWPAEHTGFSDKLFLTLHHVPLIFYAPGILEPKRLEMNASLVDVLPTALAMAGVAYENRTMGRNLVAWSDQVEQGNKESFAFTFGGDRQNNPLIGLLGERYYLTMYHDGSNPMLFDLDNPGLDKDIAAEKPNVVEQMKPLLQGWYQTARYMMHHNKNR